MRRRATWPAVTLCLVLTVAGCSDSDDAIADPSSTVADSTAAPASTTTAPVATTSAAAGGTLTREQLALADPAVEVPVPEGFTLQGAGGRGLVATPTGGGIAQIYRPPNWADIANPDGSFDHYGPGGYYYGCDSTGYCVEYVPGDHMTATEPDGSTTTWFPDGGSTETPPLPGLPPGDPDPLDFDDVVDLDAPDPDDPKFDPNHPTAPGGGGTGEPHYRSADGVWFSTQVAGELVARAGDPGHTLQIRQEPYGDRPVAIITAIAMEVGDHRVGVYATADEMTVHIDGEVVATNREFTQHDLDGGGAVGVWTDAKTIGTPPSGESIVLNPSVAIVWPDLSVVRIAGYGPRGLDVTTEWTTNSAEVSGLLGVPDGDPANDLTERDGTVADPLVDGDVAAFVETWRVGADESLFDYADGESTTTFTDLGFPPAPPAVTPEALDAAAGVCRGAGVEDEEQIERCAFDVVVTGDDGFATVHVRLAGYDAGVEAELARVAIIRNIAIALGIGVALTEDQRSEAEVVAAEEDLELAVTAGETRIVSVTAPDGTDLSLINVELSCTEPPGSDEAAYTVFDADGQRLAGPLALCAEPTSDVLAGAGPFFVEVRGPVTGDPATLRIRFRTLTPS